MGFLAVNTPDHALTHRWIGCLMYCYLLSVDCWSIACRLCLASSIHVNTHTHIHVRDAHIKNKIKKALTTKQRQRTKRAAAANRQVEIKRKKYALTAVPSGVLTSFSLFSIMHHEGSLLLLLAPPPFLLTPFSFPWL